MFAVIWQNNKIYFVLCCHFIIKTVEPDMQLDWNLHSFLYNFCNIDHCLVIHTEFV